MDDRHQTSTVEESLGRRFAANLIRERRAAAISQEELASRANLDPTEIGSLERGLRLPAVSTIMKLSGGLDVSPRALLEGMSWRPGAPGESGRFEVTQRW